MTKRTDMNILMTTVCFYPHIGGIETVTKYLAEEFVKKGHYVCVLTNTINEKKDDFPYKVIRKPTIKEVWREYKRCDVFVHQQISLKYVWPLCLRRKPWVIVHHGVDLPSGLFGYFKRFLFHFSHNICVSLATAKGYKLKDYQIINNSFDEGNFYIIDENRVRKGFAFVGKCSEAKGVRLLISAFDIFKSKTGSKATLTIVGDSEERPKIQKETESLKSYSDISFVGFKSPSEIRNILNNCKYQIIPSIANEAFGVVVLEGIACGCIPIGSSGDGIEEAMGDCGFIFKKGDVNSLTRAMENAYSLTSDAERSFSEKGKAHLSNFRLSLISDKYIQYFESLLKK